MKKSEIAGQVFKVADALPMPAVDGGPLALDFRDLAGLALVPWFCDVSVQWAFRLRHPSEKLGKSFMRKVSDAFVTCCDNGELMIGVPGDGLEPSTPTLRSLAEALAVAVVPGMALELATANLGLVNRDRQVRAETTSGCGNHRYGGTIDSAGRWIVAHSVPAVHATPLKRAVECGTMVVNNGPWEVRDRDEAFAILMCWMGSPQANVNPLAVERFITLNGLQFTNHDPLMTRKLAGLGLGFFRTRVSRDGYAWSDDGPVRNPAEVCERVARHVIG